MNLFTAGILRHILTTAGGVLVAKGYLEEGMLQEVIGAVLTLAGVAWSMWEKRSAS